MRTRSLWRRLLGVEDTVIERVEFDGVAAAVMVEVRPHSAIGVAEVAALRALRRWGRTAALAKPLSGDGAGISGSGSRAFTARIMAWL